MTVSPKLTYIPDLVEEHFDELQFLWGQRRRAIMSASHGERQLATLEERIEGHADGLLVIGDRLIDFVAPALAGDEELAAFAAGFALLRLGTADALRRVLYAFETAAGKRLEGLRDAMAHAPGAAAIPELTAFFLSAPPPVAAAAGEALLFRYALTPVPQHVERFLRAEDPGARAAGWRIVAYSGMQVPAEWYAPGLRDEDPRVQRAALVAAAWNGATAFAPYCRALATQATPDAVDALTMFAAVAPPEEYQLLAVVATNPAAGPHRFRVVGAFGHPYFVDLLITEMQSADPAAAAAAGAAFTKLTGVDVESDRRAKVSPDGKPPADEFEAEFMDELFVPDPVRARKHWHELAPRLAHSARICRGMDVAQPLTREQFAALDMESRWEHCLRARLFSGWQGTPLVLERYPQRF